MKENHIKDMLRVKAMLREAPVPAVEHVTYRKPVLKATVRDPDGNLCVYYLHWSGCKWGWGFSWLGGDWRRDDGPAAPVPVPAMEQHISDCDAAPFVCLCWDIDGWD